MIGITLIVIESKVKNMYMILKLECFLLLILKQTYKVDFLLQLS